MSRESTQHDTFVVKRTYPAAPPRVFAAWSRPEAKARWFFGPEGWKAIVREMDFRPGGVERVHGRGASGTTSAFDARYHDIVPDRRIVYAYEMRLDGVLISVSLATVEFEADGAGTRLTVTEQGAFVDGYDDKGSREHGTGVLMDQLGSALQAEPVNA